MLIVLGPSFIRKENVHICVHVTLLKLKMNI